MKDKLFRKELRAIFSNKKLLIPIIAVLFIPVLYSGMFLWAFWDPYEHLSDLPVAVVNEDTGAQIEGENLMLGRDLADKLKESQEFGFEMVSDQKGKEGLKQQKYYMLIKIPKDFSKAATTLMEDHPEKLELIYMPNESFNFLSSQIGGTAAERIKASVSEKVSETYAEAMFENLGNLSDGLRKASEGASKLNDGTEKVSEGSIELYQNLALLADKSVQFTEGMNTARGGIEEVEKGADALADGLGKLEEGQEALEAASGELLTGEKELAAGAVKLKAGLNEVNTKTPALTKGTVNLTQGSHQLVEHLMALKSGTSQTAAGAARLHDGIAELKSKMEMISPSLSPELQQQLAQSLQELEEGSAGLAVGTKSLSDSTGAIAGGAQAVSTGLDELVQGQTQLQKGLVDLADGGAQLEAGANRLAEGQTQFHSGMNTFGSKLSEAKAGAEKLSIGSEKLAGGAEQLAAGSSAMTGGAQRLTEGAKKLSDGNQQVADGMAELTDKLKDGADKAQVNSDEETYNMMADPVKLKSEKFKEVPNYGTGFAPYFLSLGLFVGALLLSIVFPLTEPAGVPSSGLSWFLSKFGILTIIGTIQALAADAVLLFGLNLEVTNIPLFLIFTIITSITFVSLVQFLVTWMGDPGRFVAIIILILQLTTSAGTFPLELIPNALQPFNAYLPMTYSVQGFKAVISSGDVNFLWHNSAILGIYIGLLATGTFVYFQLFQKRRFAVEK